MNSIIFGNILETYLNHHKVYRMYEQLFNKAVIYYGISPFRVECFRKYYVLDSEDAKDWVNEKQLSELARANNTWWDGNIRKRLTRNIDKYMHFHLSEIPLKERLIEDAYLTPREIIPLKNGGIKTIGDILSLPNIDLLGDIPKIGGKSLRLIKEFIADIERH